VENFDDHLYEFLGNDTFMLWITHPDDASNAYWNNWMKENPEQEADLLKARQLALDLAAAQTPTIDTGKLSGEIWANMQATLQSSQRIIPITRNQQRKNNYWIAASLAGLLLLAASLYFVLNTRKNSSDLAEQKVAALMVKDSLQQINTSTKNRMVYLVDGTKITLQPGASIKHMAFFQKNIREVNLEGDAFFEVAKDPARPFYVYTHDIVLRVLGTSFNVRRDNANGNITVLVRTGKVSVYNKKSTSKPAFILTPNEGIRYTAQTEKIEKSESDKAFLKLNSKPAAAPVNFNFEETPVTAIFNTIQDAYGIKIHYDEKRFASCIVNTSMGDEPFDEKLQIICEAVGVNYKIDHNEVFVTGTPCK
jgi:ferric-dicitrate binding protein FerR (iron transport regulator)